MTLGQRIKERRETLGITQRDLADNVRITLKHISSIEQGKRTPSLPLMVRISECLNASLDYLVTGKEVTADSINAIQADETLDNEAKITIINLVKLMRLRRKME